MNDDRDEKEMRDLFQVLRREDERVAPPFSESWEGALARVRRPSRSWRLVRALAAAAVLTLLGVFVMFSIHTMRPPESGVEVSKWRSPTNSLLESLDDPLLKTVPRLGGPSVDIKLVLRDTKSGGWR